jgi:hypothetical protein
VKSKNAVTHPAELSSDSFPIRVNSGRRSIKPANPPSLGFAGSRIASQRIGAINI